MKKILVAILLVAMMVLSISACDFINPKVEPKTFTVTFDCDGGSAVAPQTVKEGEAATKPADPTKEGYTFAGWYLGEAAYDFSSKVTADITVKAAWEQITYDVTFDVDGGSAVDAQTVAFGGKATKPADPTKAGFTFIGWFVGETAYDFDATVTADVTVKAVWEQITYDVTFDADNGSEAEVKTVAWGAKAEKPADPEKEGFTFIGWYAGETAYDFDTPVTADVELKAVWAEIAYKVIFDTDGGSAVEGQTVAFGGKATKPADPTKDGYYFMGWFVGETAFDFDAVLTADANIKASWLAIPDLTAIAGKWAGTGSGYPAYSYEFIISADGTVNAKFNNTYNDVVMEVTTVAFDGTTLTINYISFDTAKTMVFTYADGTLKSDSAEMDDSLTLNKTYTVTFDWGNYKDEVDPTVKTVVHGNKVIAPSKSWTGYEVKAWLLNGEAFDLDTPITSDITLVANWGVKMIKVTFVGQDGKTAETIIEVPYNTQLGTISLPTSITTTGGYKFNGKWYTKETGTSPIKSTDTTKITSAVTYYPGLIAPMTDIAGKWTGTDSKGTAYTMEVDAVNQTVAITTVTSAGVTDEFDITTILYKEFVSLSSTAVKLVVRYIPDGSTSESTLTLTYADGKFTGSSSLTLEKEGIKKHTVTFDSAEGTAVDPQTIVAGAKAEKPADPTKDGFIFDGWYLGENAYDFETAVTGDITLVAKWTEKPAVVEHTVTFDSAEGTAVEAQTVLTGAKAQKPADPSKEKYKFLGWYVGDVEYDFDTPVTADITLTAKWVEIKNLVFIKQDGTKVYYSSEKGKIVEDIITENYAEIMATIKDVSADTITVPTTFDEMKLGLADALCTDKNSKFTGMWFTSATGTTEFNFSQSLTSDKNICPAFISTDALGFVGTWECTKTSSSSTTTYKFIFDVTTDAEGKVTGVNVSEANKNGTAYTVLWVRTYFVTAENATNVLPQIHIRYQGNSSKMTFTIKQAVVDDAYVWQIDNTTLVKQ